MAYRVFLRGLAPSSVVFVLAVAALGCGGSKAPAEDPSAEGSGDGTPAAPGGGSAAQGPLVDADERKTEGASCTGMTVNLLDALSQAACEVPGKPESEKTRDLKDTLDVKVATSAPKVAPGGKLDVVVTFTNKGKEPLPLRFVVNPLPRFSLEVYDAKKNRVDEPKGNPPPWPGGKEPLPAEEKLAEIVLPERGSGHVMLTWTASRMKWAPSKARGAAMGSAYPKEPSTPLPKGKYTLRVVTPLAGAFEGSEREVSAPSVTVDVGK